MTEAVKRVRVPDLIEKKKRGERIAVLTAYDFAMAQILDSAGVDVLLVGDSLANVVLGYETTLPVTLDAMIHHTAAVSRGATRALVVADMPFLAAQVNIAEAVRSAGRLLREGGAAAVKIEGGRPVVDEVRRLVDIGIPVMGHLGLLPQSVHQLGGYGRQATQEQTAARLLEDARLLQEAGAFSLVLESIPPELAGRVSAELRIPTIGIGAGPRCDGQVQVCYDMLGLSRGPVPPFVKRYADLGAIISQAAAEYCADVRGARFPAAPEKKP
jgi:3-methyl-2-oxobutanoate hydroxymethyltransferase